MLLAIGGAQEALLAWPGTYDIVLNKRFGARCCHSFCSIHANSDLMQTCASRMLETS